MPKISIVLPVRNAAQYLQSSLLSIYNQSFIDYELLIMDDGSEDHTLRLADYLTKGDPRVKIFERDHRGLVTTLNELLALADSPYIARMDADDIARPERLEKQAKHLDDHGDTGVLGSWVQTFGGKTEIWHFRRWDNFSRNLLFFGVTILCHPSWMVRREIYDRHKYDDAFRHIEDREWLARVAAAERQIQFIALPEILLDYRVHSASITGRRQAEQQRLTPLIIQNLLSEYGCALTSEQLDRFMKVVFTQECDLPEIALIGEVVEHVSTTIKESLADDHHVFREFWLKFCECNRAASTLVNKYLPDRRCNFLKYRELERC